MSNPKLAPSSLSLFVNSHVKHACVLCFFLSLACLRCLAGGVTVEGNSVNGTSRDTRKEAAARKRLDTRAKCLGVSGTLKSKEIGTKANNVGSCHGGTRDSVGTSTGPGGEDILAGSKDIHNRAVVREGGSSISRSRGTNSADSRLGSRRGVASISTIITSSDGQEDAGVDQGGSSSVDGSGKASTKRHVGDGAVGAVSGLRVVGNKVHARNDVGKCTAARVVEDLDAVDRGLLRNAIGAAANGARDVGSVAVTISVLA